MVPRQQKSRLVGSNIESVILAGSSFLVFFFEYSKNLNIHPGGSAENQGGTAKIIDFESFLHFLGEKISACGGQKKKSPPACAAARRAPPASRVARRAHTDPNLGALVGVCGSHRLAQRSAP